MDKMLELKRTSNNDKDFLLLIEELNTEQAQRNGDKNDFYMQFNQLDQLNHVVVALLNKQAVACGALRELNDEAMEIKRMYTRDAVRNKGYATAILNELEAWTMELGYEKCILETGTMNPEAIKFYKKNKYSRIPNYEPYTDDEDSLCFEKQLTNKH